MSRHFGKLGVFSCAASWAAVLAAPAFVLGVDGQTVRATLIVGTCPGLRR
jgi:hypothetical protein